MQLFFFSVLSVCAVLLNNVAIGMYFKSRGKFNSHFASSSLILYAVWDVNISWTWLDICLREIPRPPHVTVIKGGYFDNKNVNLDFWK